MLLPLLVSSRRSLQQTMMVLLLTAVHMVEGRIQLMQTRVSVESEPTWPVAGVASLELHSDVVGYWFDCNAGEDTSLTRLTWERVGHTRNPFEVARLSTGSSRLIVGGGQLARENLGHYRCWHRDTGESTDLLLTGESPAIIADQDIVTAETRQMVTLSVHISTFLGPLPANQLQITWYLPGRPALNANDTRIEGHVTGSSLVVANVTADSVGKYSCTVEQSRDSVTYNSSTSIDLRLFIPAAILSQPSPTAVPEGHNAPLTCTGTGSPPPTITWRKRTGASSSEITDSQRVHILQQTIDDSDKEGRVSSRLVLVEAVAEDSGVYYCEAHNQLNGLAHTAQSQQVNLSVTDDSVEPLLVRVTYNSISSTSHSVVLFSGDLTKPTFRCSADGHPSPSVSWSISHSHSAPANIHYTYELTQTELSLVWEQPVEVSDSGLYECVASNSQGESRASVHLTVIHKPVIDSIIPGEGINLLSAKDKSETEFEIPTSFIGTLLSCSGYSWPVPIVQWTTPDSGGDLPCGMVSQTRTHRDGVVKAELAIDSPFNQSCAIRVQCEVLLPSGPLVDTEAQNTSLSVVLVQGGRTEPKGSTEFQLRLKMCRLRLCSQRTEEETARIKTSLGRALSRTVANSADENRECINISSLVCDKDGVGIVAGTLQDCRPTSSLPTHTATLYSFLGWKNSGPLISLNGTLCEVDKEFPLCLTDSECGLSHGTEDAYPLIEITIGLYVASGAVFLLVMVLMVVLCCKLRRLSCWHNARKSRETASRNSRDITIAGTNTKPNEYIV